MKKYAIIIIILMFTLSFFAFSQENISFKKMDLSEHYKVIDLIISDPDSIIKILFENKLLTNTTRYDTIKINHFKYLIPFIKQCCNKEYKIIDDELLISSKLFDNLKGYNIAKAHYYFNAHIVKTKNIKNNIVQYFYFTFNEEKWKLFNIQDQSPHEYPNNHLSIVAMQEKQRKKIDTNNPEHCKLYNDESYIAIKKLLNNPDSLYNLYAKIFPSGKLEEKLEAVKLFAQYAKKEPQELIVKIDRIFLPLKDFPDKSITILNEIELVSPNIPKNIFKFYFMKKDGVWQFYDGKLDVFSRFPLD